MKVKNLEVENLFGKINRENVFVGNIVKCTKFDGNVEIEESLYKGNQLLIKICDNPRIYVELRELVCFLSYIYIYNQIDKNGIKLNDKILCTFATKQGSIYVDEKSLKPYYKETGKVRVKRVKRYALYDCRIPGGIEH